ncbi:MAG: CHAT domain-containing tetratricopeptide repeat protein [Bacteroidota bacterium]
MKSPLVLSILLIPGFLWPQIDTNSAPIIQQLDSLIQLNETFLDAQEYEEALSVIQVAKGLFEESSGQLDSTYARCLYRLGLTYRYLGEKEKAETYYLASKDMWARVVGKEHPGYDGMLDKLGYLYETMGQYDDAERMYLELVELREGMYGKKDPQYAGGLIILGLLYYIQKDLDQAKQLYLEAKDIFTSNPDLHEHPLYADCLDNLGNLYDYIEEYDAAKSYKQQVIPLREKISGRETTAFAGSLINLGNLYYKLGQDKEAEDLYVEAYNIFENNPQMQSHSFYMNCLGNLGLLYWSLGQYEKAEPLYLKTKEIAKLSWGDHPNTAQILNYLGLLYSELGQYEKVEAYYLESLRIREKTLGKEHPSYSTSLVNLGLFYQKVGQYEKAESLFEQGLRLGEKIFGKNHINYLGNLVNLALLRFDKGDYEESKQLFLEAKELFEGDSLKMHHPFYVSCLIGLGDVLVVEGQYEEAEALFLKLKELGKQAYGKDHLHYAGILNNLAYVYQLQGRFEEAEQLYLEDKAIVRQAVGTEHANYAQAFNSLGVLYDEIGQHDKALRMFETSAPIHQSLLVKASAYSSEQELASYIQNFVAELNDVYSLAHHQSMEKNPKHGLFYDQSLFYKGFLLNAAHGFRRLENLDADGKEKLLLWKSYHRQLADEYARPLHEREGIADLEEKANLLEKDLVRSASNFAQAIRQVSWEEIKNRLNPDEAAIEFVHYRPGTMENQDSVIYAAILLRSTDSAPAFIPLFDEHSLSLTVSRQQFPRDKRSLRGIKPRKRKQQASHSLNWKPLIQELEGIQTIYYAPSGLLHRLNLSAASLSKKESFADKFDLIQLNSTRRLAVPISEQDYASTAILFGGVSYEPDSEVLDGAATSQSRGSTASRKEELHIGLTNRDLRSGRWNYLMWTAKEVEQIQGPLTAAHFSIIAHTGPNATEEAFRSIGQSEASPRVLHLATHGFFFPDPVADPSKRNSLTEPSFIASDHPMIRSGLVLAGANHVWQGNPPLADREDGILTAYEISQMDLSQTELVVLSACETGLGDIKGNEGVYGLQRAFRIAGARYLIMSLWQVPDKETMEFMEMFYSNWLEKEMTIPEAFRMTQQSMRNTYKDPNAWAAFVLVE